MFIFFRGCSILGQALFTLIAEAQLIGFADVFLLNVMKPRASNYEVHSYERFS